MFEDLIGKLEALDGQQLSVSIPADPEGYFDRACPSDVCLFEFKIHENDWRDKVRDEEVFCPFCRHGAPADEWWTEAQIEHAQKKALGQISGELNSAMRRDADRWKRRQPRDSFTRMTMSVKDRPTHMALPPAAAEPMQLKVMCPACECRYAVIGAAYFCPACGHNAVSRDFSRTLDTIRASLDAIPQVRVAFGDDRDAAENTVRTMIESGLGNGVMAFQRYAEALYRTKPDVAPPQRNVFQSLSAGSALWEDAFGLSFEIHLGADRLAHLNRYFQQRHLLAHKDGIVDEDYIPRSGDTSYTVGQRIVVKADTVRDCVDLIEVLTRGLATDAGSDD